LAVSVDSTLVAAGGDDGKIRLSALADGTLKGVFAGHSQPVSSVQFSNDNLKLVSAGGDGTVRIWDVKLGKQMQHFVEHQRAVARACFAPDSRTVVSAGKDGLIQVNVVSLQRMHMADEKEINDFTLSQNGAVMATANSDGAAKAWDFGSGNLLRAFPG